MGLSRQEKYVISIIAEDLEQLSKEWNDIISDSSLRRGSTALRIISEGKYNQAWRLLGLEGQPVIEAVDLKKTCSTPRENLIHAIAFGAKYQSGTMIASVGPQIRSLTPKDPRDKLVFGRFPLTEFFGSPSIITPTVTVKRVDVVKYFANKRGGAHIDTTRETPNELKNELMDRLDSELIVLDKSALYFELLSIGQALINGHSTTEFLERANGLKK